MTSVCRALLGASPRSIVRLETSREYLAYLSGLNRRKRYPKQDSSSQRGIQQGLRGRMPRMFEYIVHPSLLDNPPLLHHCNAVA